MAMTASLFFGTSYFRDMSLVFEGGYRIALGQLPYRDFYMPVGPVLFYMQGLCDLVFGHSALAMLAHSAILAATMAVMGYRLARRDFGPVLATVFSGFMVLALNGVFGSPWYNFTAHFFVAVIVMLLMARLQASVLSPRFVLFLAVLSVLAMFSKQDAAVAVPLIALYLALSGGMAPTRVATCYVLPCVLLSLALAGIFEAGGDFLYWFNLGQSPHSARLVLSFDLVWAVVGQWRFWLILGAIVYLAVRRPAKGERRSTVLCLILVAAVPLVILQSSGLSEQTRMQGVPLLLLLIFRLARDSETLAAWRRRLGADWGLRTLSARAGLFARILLLLFLAKLVPPLALFVSLDVNVATLAGREGFSGVAKGLVRMEEGSYRGILVSRPAHDDLVRIRSLLNRHQGDFINLSELGFLYADFATPPPTGLPLWLDEGISFFDVQVPLLTSGIVDREPRVILLQDAFDHADPTLHDRIGAYYARHGYSKLFSAEAPRRDRKIDVFVRQPVDG